MALEWLAEQMKRQEPTVTVTCDLTASAVTEDQAMLLFQSARELLINVLKHSGTVRASVSAWITTTCSICAWRMKEQDSISARHR